MPGKKDFSSLHLLFKRFLKPYWKVVSAITLINILVGFLVSLRPLVIAPALDVFVSKRPRPAGRFNELTLNNLGVTIIDALHLDVNNILQVGLLVSGLFFLFSLLIASVGFGSFVLTIRTRTAMYRDMMVALHQHLLTLPLAFFQKRRAGELLSRLNNDVTKTATFLDNIVRSMLQSLAQIAVTLFILFRTDLLLSFSLLALGSLHILITRLLSGKVKRRASGVFEKLGMLNANLFETFLSIRLIKSFAAEAYDSRKIITVANLFRRYELRFTIVRHIEEPLRIVADALIIGIVLILVFNSVIQERLTLQASLIFFYLSQQLLAPVSNLANQFLNIQNMIGAAAEVTALFETRNSISDGTRPSDVLTDQIIFSNIDFAYEDSGPVLQDINFSVKKGEVVALVGPSGAGKSTLFDLLLRFYDTTRGSICYDGVDIRSFNQSSYRRQFGVVSQESLLFNTSIQENIIYNRPENPQHLKHAIWAANAEEFINQLPQGLETRVGDRGLRLSGGQKQRIAIARAIYGHPSILLLDEATSALDSESEKAVQTAINRIRENRTALIIAHRLSTITQADKIVVLNKGRIEAIGNHEVVYRTSNTYRRLYDLQFKSPEGAE
jgi:subfamily B ATP-binding cassette protein MsbA